MLGREVSKSGRCGAASPEPVTTRKLPRRVLTSSWAGVPLLVTTDEGFFAVTSDEQVVAVLQQKVDGMRAAGYSHSQILGSEVTVLNSTSALYRGTLSRQRSDGAEISRLTATYLVTDGPARRRISALLVHSPD